VSWRSATLGLVLQEYSLYRIYAWDAGHPTSVSDGPTEGVSFKPCDEAELEACPDVEMSNMTGYLGEDAHVFGAWADGSLAAACCYWTNPRYRSRGFWPLSASEGKLVQIVTATAFRRRGIARLLIRHSSTEMARRGFTRLFARVWHSHEASYRAFERAGWDYVAFVTELRVRGVPRPLRYVRHRHKRSALLAGTV
jgi:ribosomal protein S18 acetylase RimI-like enzyme